MLENIVELALYYVYYQVMIVFFYNNLSRNYQQLPSMQLLRAKKYIYLINCLKLKRFYFLIKLR